MKSAKKQGDKVKGDKKRRQRRAAVLNVVRLLALLAGGTLGAFLLFQVVAKIIYPYRLGYQEAKKVAALQTRMDRASALNAYYQKRVDFLKSPEGAEMLARHGGYHYPGETAYLLKEEIFNDIPGAPTEADVRRGSRQ